mmetsp:Transcript_69390/g.110208  ORF Transcript_69390/g.110208 Transcript_69390/m.110208 type:complete len:252 (-) Transcript_69390:80-835(-)
MASWTVSEIDSISSGLDIAKLVKLLQIAERAERYEDMIKIVKKLVELKSEKAEDLSSDERDLLSIAYKNVVGAKRSTWRALSSGFDDTDEELLKKYRSIVEDELEAVCQDLLSLLTTHLLKHVPEEQHETEVFYLKMCGDYYRYLSEFRSDDQLKTSAKEYYTKALTISDAHLTEIHPTRLGLALNCSVFYYEILTDMEKACDLARTSLEGAIAQLDSADEATYKNAVLILQLLRDNLTLWTSANVEAEEN